MRGGFKFKGQTYTCDCPDFSGQHSYTFKGTPLLRDWSSSAVGAVGTNQEACKHIWATLLDLKLVEKSDIPRDIPIPIFSNSDTRTKKPRNATSRNPFEIPKILGFKPYQGG